MSPEKRMILAAALLAVAQQDPELVKLYGIRPARSQHVRQLISEEARLFIASESFDEMTETIEVEASRLRRMTPNQAQDAYNRITSDNWREFDIGVQ